MNWVYDDGGRADAGFKGETNDCVTRAVAIATGQPYREVYDELHARYKAAPGRTRTRAGNRRSTSPRSGLPRRLYEPYLREHGWVWTPTMQIGTGCRVHLRADELPVGTLVARCSGHLTTVIDGVIHDTFDPSREGTRCVYGYFTVHQIEHTYTGSWA